MTNTISKYIKQFAVLASVLMIAVIAIPMVAAERVEILPVMPDKFSPNIEELPLSIEVIENTRELAIFEIGDGKNGILITQAIDEKNSTKDTTIAILKIENLNSGEVEEEMKIITSYDAGLYSTTIYNEVGVLNTFSSQFDPLEPGVLNKKSLNDVEFMKSHQNNIQNDIFLQSNNRGRCPITNRWTFNWDGFSFVCGGNADMPFSRPNLELFRDILDDPGLYCGEDTWFLRGNNVDHLQLSRSLSSIITDLSPIGFIITIAIFILAVKGVKFATITWDDIDDAVGILESAIGTILTKVALDSLFIDDRGNIWLFIGRIPINHINDYVPRFLRAGRVNVVDVCSIVPTIPCPDTFLG